MTIKAAVHVRLVLESAFVFLERQTKLKYLGQQFFLLLCLLEEIHVTRQVNECFQVLKCLQYPRNNRSENKWQTNEGLIQSIR